VQTLVGTPWKLAFNSLKNFMVGLKMGKTHCPLMEGVLVVAICVEGNIVLTKE
jgi:hypothetical protein